MLHFSLSRAAVLALCGCSSLSVLAAETAVLLDNQVVTASRTAEAPIAPIASTATIERVDIERSQAKTVPDLLRGLAGVSVTSNGGRGKSSSVSIRGTQDKHLLVLIDGVKVGSATSGTAALHSIPLEQIERIEVVRGPRSSLYGSEAMGGVIQIFTRRGEGPGLRPWASVGAGSRSTFDGSVGVSGGSSIGWFNLGLAGESTDGINARAYRSNAPRAFEPDADGYREKSASLRGGLRFDNGLELDGSLLEARSHNDYDTRASNGNSGRFAYADGELQVIGARARFSPLDFWAMTLQGGHSEDRSDAYQDERFFSRFDTVRDNIGWQNDFSLGEDHLVTLGFDYQKDRIDTSSRYAQDTRDNEAVYLQYMGRFGRHGLQLGLRHDDDSLFGNHDTGSVGWSFALTGKLELSASWGTAFRAPTFNDLYYPAAGTTAGNPDVQPEESQSYEIGLAGNHDWGTWSLNAFENQIEDLIVWARDGGGILRPSNVESARIRGLEAVLGTQLLGWDVATNLTFLDPRDRSAANHGNLLQRRARRSLNVDVDRQFGQFGVGATVYASSERYDVAANTEVSRMPGYALVDLRGEYRVNDEWRLQARLSNLFDRDYETTQTYEQPGRAVHFTVRYQAL